MHKGSNPRRKSGTPPQEGTGCSAPQSSPLASKPHVAPASLTSRLHLHASWNEALVLDSPLLRRSARRRAPVCCIRPPSRCSARRGGLWRSHAPLALSVGLISGRVSHLARSEAAASAGLSAGTCTTHCASFLHTTSMTLLHIASLTHHPPTRPCSSTVGGTPPRAW